MSVIVNRVWNGSRFVTTDSDTVDGKHAADFNASSIEILEHTDLNSLKEEGFYTCSTLAIANSIINYPNGYTKKPFSLLVQKSDYTTQVLINSDRTNFKVFVRVQTSTDQWSEWKSLGFEDHQHDNKYADKIHNHMHVGQTSPSDTNIDVWIETQA